MTPEDSDQVATPLPRSHPAPRDVHAHAHPSPSPRRRNSTTPLSRTALLLMDLQAGHVEEWGRALGAVA
ncbi:hypothetical protein [Streptomyces sp. x-19]|uniref:hypothetical protein n=1 Tax=Streptomyces sp. x-19 TaxID=2789280 RepID=UPI00397FF268